MIPQKSHRDNSQGFQSTALLMLTNPKLWLRQFHNIFLYGKQIQVLHKGKPKFMSVYLDNNREKLLWISSKTKAFLFDLYFTTVSFEQNEEVEKMKPRYYYFTLRQFSEYVIMMFETEGERNKMIKYFNLYIEELRIKYPQYCAYFSKISKQYALESTKNGTNLYNTKQILAFSKQIGLNHEKQNARLLESSIAHHKITNKKSVPFQCIDDYFRIQFCSRTFLDMFEKYSSQRLLDYEKNPFVYLEKKMQFNQFRYFLVDHQKQTSEKVDEILKNFSEPLSFFDFCLFLYDQHYNSITKHQTIDESYPLNHYFCYSSHNTYLSGNQLTSDSKVSRYSEDLQNGIKCVELDVHDDGDTPIITHAIKGQGFCKQILFEDVIKAIDRFSEESKINEVNHYPIILSIQNHASEENKEKMLDIMTKYFGTDLYVLDEQDLIFPTLSQLRGKIVIKTSSKEEQLRKMLKKQKGDAQEGLSYELTKSIQKLSHPQIEFKNIEIQGDFQKFRDFKENIQKQKMEFMLRMEKMQQFFLPVSSMAKITSIFKAQKGIKTENSTCFQCTSMTNKKVIDTKKEQIIEYSKRSWLRTYPTGAEIASDNYDPIPMLEVGAQIIALNTQTKDKQAWTTHGYFCSGRFCPPGNKGYVLKPARLLPGNDEIPEQRWRVKIEVLERGGYHVKLQFRGVTKDMEKNEGKDKQFIISHIDESFIIFKFGEDEIECVALRFLGEGYRVVQVKNKQNYLDKGGRIIVRVQKEKL